MAQLDHLGITVGDMPRAIEQFHPVMEALGYTQRGGEDSAWWVGEGLVEILLYEARDGQTEPHVHGRVGWQHLAFGFGSRSEVDRVHAVAVEAGWTTVRAPKEYPRFSSRYYAAFVEDDNGVRFEFAFNPPSADG